MAGLSRVLHHWSLDPFSRQARIAAAEKGIKLRLREERAWDGRQDFLALSPEGRTPVLVEGVGPGRTVIAGARALLEYFEEIAPEPTLLPGSASMRAEARRLADWFDRKYDAEVNATLAFELADKRMMGLGQPSRKRVAEGRANLQNHLHYITQLAEGRGFLAGEAFSIADIAAVAHLSGLEALGALNWRGHAAGERWWRLVTSRESVAPLLEETAPETVAA